MNADVEELLKSDVDARRVVDMLGRAPQAHVAAGFSARVMSEIREQRRRVLFSVSSAFAAAASIVALLAIGSIFFRSVPKPSISAWVERPLTVRLAPYNPAEWYAPLAFDDSSAGAGVDCEPFCTLEALNSCSVLCLPTGE